jgi:hypothetical protein
MLAIVVISYHVFGVAGLTSGNGPSEAASPAPVVAEPDLVAVPSVLYVSVASAQETLYNSGLNLQIADQQYDVMVPADYVKWQNPMAGALLLPGDTVRVQISKGPRPPRRTSRVSRRRPDEIAEIHFVAPIRANPVLVSQTQRLDPDQEAWPAAVIIAPDLTPLNRYPPPEVQYQPVPGMSGAGP